MSREQEGQVSTRKQRETLESLNFSQQKVSRLRERCSGEGGWAGSLRGLKAQPHFVLWCVEMVKGLLRTAGLSTRFGEEDEAAWGRMAVLGRRAKVSAEKLRQRYWVKAHCNYYILSVAVIVRTSYESWKEIAYVEPNLLSCC